MNNYKDSWGRFHHKPVTEQNPVPSNNSFIYSAFAAKVGIAVIGEPLFQCYQQCLKNGKLVYRSPGKELPPMSRDEILGVSYLQLLKPTHLNGWNFSPFPIPKFSAVKLAKQLLQYWGEISIDQSTGFALNKNSFPHRNYFWQNNLDQLYRFAFSVPLTDRHFILSNWGKYNAFYHLIALIDSRWGKTSGIRWLKYGVTGKSTLADMVKEFPADHPIAVEVSRQQLGL